MGFRKNKRFFANRHRIWRGPPSYIIRAPMERQGHVIGLPGDSDGARVSFLGRMFDVAFSEEQSPSAKPPIGIFCTHGAILYLQQSPMFSRRWHHRRGVIVLVRDEKLLRGARRLRQICARRRGKRPRSQYKRPVGRFRRRGP